MTQDEEIRNTLAKVITICAVHLPDGSQTITDKDILGKSRREDILTAQCLFVPYAEMVTANTYIGYIINVTSADGIPST